MSWITLLKAVPWSEVLSNAPKVAEGAKKLWGKVAKDDALSRGSAMTGSSATRSAGSLEMRVEALEADVTALHSQLLASSELITALAEQNTQLIGRMQVARSRMIWLTIATAGSGVIALTSLWLTQAH